MRTDLLPLLALAAAVSCSGSSCSAGTSASAGTNTVKPAPLAASPAADVFLVAAVQTPSRMGDVKANTRRLERLARRAARRGARFVVFPEAAVTGYLSQDLKRNWHVNGRPLAEEFTGISPEKAALGVSGPTIRHFQRLARELGVYLVVPFVEKERHEGGLLYFNTACLIDPAGEIVLHYRKINPWPFPEDAWATAGEKLAVASTPYGRVGLLICFDVHTLPPRLARAGAEVLLYPIAWVDDPDSPWFEKHLPRIARENKVSIVGANWSVDDPTSNRHWHGAGQSRIIDREGKILAAATRDVGEEILYATLRRSRPPTVRR